MKCALKLSQIVSQRIKKEKRKINKIVKTFKKISSVKIPRLIAEIDKKKLYTDDFKKIMAKLEFFKLLFSTFGNITIRKKSFRSYPKLNIAYNSSIMRKLEALYEKIEIHDMFCILIREITYLQETHWKDNPCILEYAYEIEKTIFNHKNYYQAEIFNMQRMNNFLKSERKKVAKARGSKIKT